MITVTRVTIYDSISRRMSFNVSDTFDNKHDAKRYYRIILTDKGQEVTKILIDYEEEDK